MIPYNFIRMRKNFFETQHPLVEFLLISLITFCSFFVFSLLSMLIAVIAFDLPISDLSRIAELINHPEDLRLLKFFQSMQTIGIFIVPSLLIVYFMGGSFARNAGFVKLPSVQWYVLGVLILLAFMPFINLLGELNANLPFPDDVIEMERQAMLLTEKLVKADTLWQLLFNLFMIAVLPAIGEELFFRNVLQNYFVKITKNKHLGVLLAAFFFSFIHFQFLGFFPRFFLGLVFGYLYVWSGSILIAILAHFVNNALAVLAMYFVAEGQLSEQIEQVGAQPEMLPLAILSLIGGALLMFYFYKLKTRYELKTQVL